MNYGYPHPYFAENPHPEHEYPRLDDRPVPPGVPWYAVDSTGKVYPEEDWHKIKAEKEALEQPLRKVKF
jgi:hypothetical protein